MVGDASLGYPVLSGFGLWGKSVMFRRLNVPTALFSRSGSRIKTASLSVAVIFRPLR